MLRNLRWVGLGLVVGSTCVALVEGVPTPGLTVAPYSTNQIKITITNGVAGVGYELHSRTILADPAYSWTFYTRGAVSQTNFFIPFSVETVHFFQASASSDWDGDGVLNDVDGQPSNASVGSLAITIDYPTSGIVLQ